MKLEARCGFFAKKKSFDEQMVSFSVVLAVCWSCAVRGAGALLL